VHLTTKIATGACVIALAAAPAIVPPTDPQGTAGQAVATSTDQPDKS